MNIFTRFTVVKFTLFAILFSLQGFSQITTNINSGNPKFPFPQFLGYTGAPNTLANLNPVGVPHAEMEQRIKDAYQILTNNMTYNVNKGGAYASLTVKGVKYIMPNVTATSNITNNKTCAEGDGYFLLAAAYMGDKITFDGYYMWAHDRGFEKTARFIDGVVNTPTYAYSAGISGAGNPNSSTDVLGGGAPGNSSAADGDEDIALALLVAWQQWGDNGRIGGGGTTDFFGNPIYYKNEAISLIKALVDTIVTPLSLPIIKYATGDIGLDGYEKGGDSWAEETSWANGGTWMGLQPEQVGPQNNYVDYLAPAYHRVFGDMLAAQGESPWCINQYRRGEASGDWVMGQAYAQGYIPWAGKYTVTNPAAPAIPTVTFANVGTGEDFRFGWRTILNYVWQGDAIRNWDPVNHVFNTVAAPANKYEYNMAGRFASFLKNPEGAPFNNAADIYTSNTLQYCGPQTLSSFVNNLQGTADNNSNGTFIENWLMGTGAPSAVISGDTDLMAQMFRQAVIEWDQADVVPPATGAGSEQYLLSMPVYFHEWFRLLGMLILTGNYHNPLEFANATANMKVYKAVNKTYAHPGDTITYTISYRNYSSVTATNVVITDPLPSGLSFYSATGGGTASGGSVTWNIGTVPGFVTGGLAATQDSVQVKAIVTATSPERVCNVATITCSNGTGWTSNEYPNDQTAVMQRNCVDILTDNPIALTKTASRPTVEVSDTLVYTIVIKDQSVPFLNGGRPGVVVATANEGLSKSAGALTLGYNIYHGADEPLIDYKNYRISYYLNKPAVTWVSTVGPIAGVGANTTPSQQALTPGPTWNQRFIMEFPEQLATTTFWLSTQYNNGIQVHQGALQPFWMVFRINDANYTNYDWTTDWSSESAITVSGANSLYYPIANDWTNPLNLNQPVLKYDPGNCTNNVTKTSTKQLVEEWDGYTWRRIYGNAPVSGRDLYNVVVKDTLPAGVTFKSFVTGYPVGTVSTSGGYTIITWPVIDTILVNDSTVYKYVATLNSGTSFGCPNPSPSTVSNHASATAIGERLTLSSVTTNVSCNYVPNLSPSVTKTADKTAYSVSDNITYTITYQNLTGTIVNSAITATKQANWMPITGSGLTGTALTVTAGSINLNSNNNKEAMYYQYSHGTNGIVKGTATLANNQTIYAIILRYNPTTATWIEVQFEVANTQVVITVLNMPSGTTIGTGNIAYSNAPNAFDFQLQLVNGSLNVWVVNSGAALSPIATLSFTGVPVQAGYAGVMSTSGSAATLTNWYTQLDSDFNLQLTDPIPSQVTYTTATTATYNAANYTGTHTNTTPDTVKWQSITGPILAKSIITYTWTGKINTCSTGSIVNIAYANVLGLTPSPAGADTVICNSVTPVSLIDFTAIPQNSDVLLQWSTASELNNNHFVVTKSYDGTSFNSIGQVPGSGNSSTIKNYSFIDSTLLKGTMYYRLVQVDNNGNTSDSKIVSVNMADANGAIILYPNPYTHETNLKVSAQYHEKITIRIMTVTGVEVYSSNNHYTNETVALGGNLPDGVYMLQVVTSDNVSTLRLVKNQ